MSGGELFLIFLFGSYSAIADGKLPSLDSLHIKALFDACSKGFVPAQAVANRVLLSNNIPWPRNIDQNISIDWLFNGASSGSLIAMSDLICVDPVLAKKASLSFREGGGYQQFYTSKIEMERWGRTLTELKSLTPESLSQELCQLAIADPAKNGRPSHAEALHVSNTPRDMEDAPRSLGTSARQSMLYMALWREITKPYSLCALKVSTHQCRL